MRIILMCGKGGVGKSTLAAAMGVKAAALGHRALVFSVDPAHSLGHAFGMPLESVPVELAPRLWGAELDTIREVDSHWGEVRDYAHTVMRHQGLEHPLGSELTMVPGVDEFAALVKLKQFHDSGQYDVIIVDNAPTGFALRMLGLPEIAGWYAKHGIRLYERYGAQLLMMLPMLGGSFPTPTTGMVGKVLAAIERLREVPRILSNPAITSARLVLTPDQLALAEAKNAYTMLSLYGLNVDEVIANQELPATLSDPFFADQLAREAAFIQEAVASFAPLPLRRVPHRANEVIGLAALASLADAVWPLPSAAGRGAPGDPVIPQSAERAIEICDIDGQVQVKIKLPFVSPKEVDLAKFENELYITIGQHRRILLLPPDTIDMHPVKAKFSEGRLLVTLARPSWSPSSP